MTTRRNYRDLSDGERGQFVLALILLKQRGVVDRFAGIHGVLMNYGMHGTSHFLPWHRRFIRQFEVELQKVNAGVALPYWDSTIDQSPSDPLWSRNFMGQFDSLWGLRRWLSDGHTMPQEVRKLLGIDPPWMQTRINYANHLNNPSFSSFSRGTEVSYHNPPHQWVGGAMASNYSPQDPVFYLHHCWIDRIWAEWQELDSRARFNAFEEYTDHNHDGGNFGIDSPLIGIGRSPRGQIDYKALGYDYGF